jgi:hypothetical protein
MNEEGLVEPESTWELAYSRRDKGVVSQEGAVRNKEAVR